MKKFFYEENCCVCLRKGDKVNEIAKLMEHMDLGVNGIIYPHREILSYTTTTRLTKKYYKMMENKIKEAYEKLGHTVIHVTHLVPKGDK